MVARLARAKEGRSGNRDEQDRSIELVKRKGKK